MKLGEIRVAQGGFEMMTPQGVLPVTLRCTNDGAVHVEEVSGGGINTTPLKISQMNLGIIHENSVDIATQSRAAKIANNKMKRDQS